MSVQAVAGHHTTTTRPIGNVAFPRTNRVVKVGQARLKAKISPGTVNCDLAVVRRILILAARAWRDENNHTWLETAPLLRMLPHEDARQPYPLSWEEQRLLFSELDGHLARMALFKVKTGTREQEVVQLRWEWEVKLPDQEKSVFVIPACIWTAPAGRWGEFRGQAGDFVRPQVRADHDALFSG